MTFAATLPGAQSPPTDLQPILDRSLKDEATRRSRLFGWVDDIIARVVVYPEDAPLVRRSLALIATCGLGLYANFHFTWDLADIYFLSLLLSSDCLGVMLHAFSHHRVFRREWDILNQASVWLLSPWFGDPPNLFGVEHIVNHHSYNNGPQDLSCTLGYQRDSLFDFVRYFLAFAIGISGVFGLARLLSGKRGGRVWRIRFFGGQAVFWIFVAVRLWQAWLPTTVLILLPYGLFNLMNRMNNWAEHAFINPDCPLDPWGNSYTILDSAYNRGAGFNEGYHATHHMRPSIPHHAWPGEFRAHVGEICSADHVMFERIDPVGIFALLMTRNYAALAKHYVQVPGRPRDAVEVQALLRSRVARQPALLARLKAAAAKPPATANRPVTAPPQSRDRRATSNPAGASAGDGGSITTS